MNEQPPTVSVGSSALVRRPWFVEPLAGPHYSACLTCGCGAHATLDADAIIAVGFGSAHVMCDDKCVYDEGEETHRANREGRDANFWQCSDAEERAAKDPEHDWRISFLAPLYEAEYQRQGEKHWVLISKGQGFA